MDTLNYDKDCSALEALFQTILSDMKTGYPVLEDFSMKAAKLHTALRTTIVAVGAFLESFQKVADMATNTRGATRDIGAALTRLCIRHKNIDAKLRAFNGAILECLVNPLQDKLEEWKRTGAQMDKDHMKEYKRVRTDWKKASENTLKLQKKAKKGKSGMNEQLECAVKEYTSKYQIMEDWCQLAARNALTEERSRYCTLVSFLKPVLIREMSMIQEIGHLQEIVTNLSQQTSDSSTLPPSSEQVILDTSKGCDAHRSFQPDYISELSLRLLYLEKSPPSSPNSLGSRKSSMCSISSMNSSSSGGSKPHSSPAHHVRTVSQLVAECGDGAVIPRQTSVSSQDSGFTSQDAIAAILPANRTGSDAFTKSSQSSIGDHDGLESEASTPSSEPPYCNQSWPDSIKADMGGAPERPHTISSAYERSHMRPHLTAYTFEPPDAVTPTNNDVSTSVPTTPSSQYARPFVGPRRGSIRDSMVQDKPPTGPKPRPKAVPVPSVPSTGQQVIYANMDDLMNNAHGNHVDFAAHPHLRKMSLPSAEDDEDECEDDDCDDDDDDDDDVMQMPNSQELANAIRELETNTASLQSSCGPSAHKSFMSLQCSSGYATMTNTPACSDDTIASGGDLDLFNPALLIINNNNNNNIHNHRLYSAQSKYCTLPRNHGDMSRAFKQMIMSNNVQNVSRDRPYSSAGMAALRRGSLPNKPAPPVRRSSSHGAPPEGATSHNQQHEVTYASPHHTPTQHRRANSVTAPECHYYPSTQSEHGTSASGSARRDLPENIYASTQVTPPRGPPSTDSYTRSQSTPEHPRYPPPNAVADRHQRTPPSADYARSHSSPDYHNPVELRRTGSASGHQAARQHANVIDTLTQKFAALHRADAPYGDLSRADSMDDLPLPPMPDDLLAAPQPEPTTILTQIRQGVQLRKVTSNDRSKPRVS